MIEDCKKIYSNDELQAIIRRFEITQNNIKELSNFAIIIEKHGYEIADRFLDYLAREPSTSGILEKLNNNILLSIKERLWVYLKEMFKGEFNPEYVNKRLSIGMLHHKSGVNEELYVSSYWKIFDIISMYAEKTLTKEEINKFYKLMSKVILMDITMTLRFYFCVKSKSINHFKELSEKDYLTKIYNRKKFEEILEQAICNSDRYVRNVSFIMFDIDDFKSINDEFGHKMGDVILK